MPEHDIPQGSFDSASDPSMNQNTSGVYVTSAPVEPGSTNAFYEGMEVGLGRVESYHQDANLTNILNEDVDHHAQGAFDDEMYRHHVEKLAQGVVAEGNAAIIGNTIQRFTELWDAPEFDAYLEDDSDNSYQNVQVSQALLGAVQQMWGIDADTAKAYAHFHRLTPLQIETLENMLLGRTTGTYNVPARPATPQVEGETPFYPEELEYLSDDDVRVRKNIANDPSISTLNDLEALRGSVFSGVNEVEWSNVLNTVLDEFEALPEHERGRYDNTNGFVELWRRGSRKPRTQTNTHRKTHAQPKQQKQGNVPADAFYKGKLRGSFIKGLSTANYERNADKLNAYMTRGLVAWDM